MFRSPAVERLADSVDVSSLHARVTAAEQAERRLYSIGLIEVSNYKPTRLYDAGHHVSGHFNRRKAQAYLPTEYIGFGYRSSITRADVHIAPIVGDMKIRFNLGFEAVLEGGVEVSGGDKEPLKLEIGGQFSRADLDFTLPLPYDRQAGPMQAFDREQLVLAENTEYLRLLVGASQAAREWSLG